jgi:ubiquinone/menaquinone biosynthesis C-methylase UbiE
VKEFDKHPGSISEIFENKSINSIMGLEAADSFLDCGCGPGGNIKALQRYLPSSKVIGFDLSPKAVEFAQQYFKGQKVEVFQGSVLDMEVFKKFPDKSIDNVLFSHMFSTLYSNNLNETQKIRQEIISQAVRIARKNVILKEGMFPEGIVVEQKFRALFQEDYSKYFIKYQDQGDVVLGKDLLIFHKR